MARRSRRDRDAVGLAEQFREIRNDYDAAKSSRFKRSRTGIVPSGSGADYHYRTERAYFGTIETSRDLFRNHCLIGQAVRRVVSNILRGGFSLDPKTGDPGADAELGPWWKEWSEDPEQCDLAGEHDWHTLERLALQQVLVDGDVMTLPQRTGHLQQSEAHRLRTPRSTQRNVVHGVLLNEYRRRMEYWVTKEDVDPMHAVARVKDIQAYPARARDPVTGEIYRSVFHHYFPDRVSQTRGLTAFVPAVDTAGMGDDLMFAQLVKAQMAACVSIFRELNVDAEGVGIPAQGQDGSTEARPDGTMRTLSGWQPGMEIYGYPGEKLQGFAPNIPNDTFFKHAHLILTIIAVNLDLPVACLLLDMSEHNFNSWRGAMDQARTRYREIQDAFIRIYHAPLYRWKVRHKMRTDRALAKLLAKPKVDPYGHRWQITGPPYLEPFKDAKANEAKVADGQTSFRRRAAEFGIDWDELTSEIVDDAALVIEKAFVKAEELNQKHDGLGVTWRDLAPKNFGGKAPSRSAAGSSAPDKVPAEGNAA